MPVPRVLVLDLGGVCCTYHPGRRLAGLGAAAGLSPDEVYARVFGSGLAERANAGELTGAEVHRLVCAALVVDLPRPELRRIWASAFVPDDAVLAVLAEVRPRLRTALLTNNGPLLRDGLDTELPALAYRFDALLFSCDLGAVKPHPAAFAAATAVLDVEPTDVLFVDDDADNVDAATAAGWRAVLHTTPGALAHRLGDRPTTTSGAVPR